jgi:hypothetical protein
MVEILFDALVFENRCEREAITIAGVLACAHGKDLAASLAPAELSSAIEPHSPS